MISAEIARRGRSARIYLRPTGFVDAPFGYDGQALRLAGGLLWFSMVEAIAADENGRFASALVPVERIEDSPRVCPSRNLSPRAPSFVT